MNLSRPAFGQAAGESTQEQLATEQAEQKQGFSLIDLLPFGRIARKFGTGEKITPGEVGLEAALTFVPFGLGKAAKVVKGVKAARGAKSAITGLKSADEAAQGLNMTQRAGRGFLRQATIAPRSSIATASEQNRLIDLAQKFPELRGTGARKFQNVEKVIGRHTDEVDGLLKGVKTTTPANSFVAQVDDLASSLEGIEQRKFRDLYNKVVRKSFGENVPDALTPLQFNAMRRQVNKQAANTYKKLERGGNLTPADEATLMLKDMLTENMEALVPAKIAGKVKGLNRDMASLINAIPEFKRLSEEGVSVLGTRVPIVSPLLSRTVQAPMDIAGRGLSNIGGNKTAMFLARQAAVRAGADITGIRGEGLTPAPEEDMSAAVLGGEGDIGAGTADSMDQQQPAFDSNSFKRDLILNALQSGELKSASDITALISLADVLSETMGGGQQKLSANQEKAMGKISDAASIADQIEQSLADAGGGGGIGGFITAAKTKIPGAASGAKAYEALRKASIAPLARSISGEVGVLTDRDIARAEGLLPKITDTPEEAALKLRNLRIAIESRKSNISSFDQNSASDALMSINQNQQSPNRFSLSGAY